MRLELTSKTDLASRAMTVLDELRAESPVGGATLAGRLGTSLHYLPQVMKPLISSGWVVSLPGPTGGYRLTPRASGADLRQLIEAVEGPIVDGKCVLKGSECPVAEPCALHDAWSRARSALIRSLEATPLIPPRTQPGKERP